VVDVVRGVLGDRPVNRDGFGGKRLLRGGCDAQNSAAAVQLLRRAVELSAEELAR
jgi:hypothetical protein